MNTGKLEAAATYRLPTAAAWKEQEMAATQPEQELQEQEMVMAAAQMEQEQEMVSAQLE